MYNEQYTSSTTFDNNRLNHSYYLDSLPYSSYNPNSPYSFRQQSNTYFPSHQHSFASSNSQDITSYSNYDTTYLNVAVAAAYQNTDPFDLNLSRHINGFHTEQIVETDRKISTKKRKYPDEITKSQYESESCRVCDDVSSGYHFGVFTCEACKGFFRRYSKKSTILEPCPVRCCINKNNRNNCAACRFDKCKCVDKIRFGKPPKIFRSSSSINSSVKLEPNNNDFQLMLKLLECYQSFEEYDQQTTTNNHSSIIFQFCHRLANIVMHENERVPETVFARLKRHESAIKFLITGENDQNLLSWSKEPQAWIFAHNERWRLIMILLILAFDDERIGGDGGSSSLDINENLYQSTNDTVIERILRLFELECDQEKETRIYTEGTITSEKNLKYMKAQFVLRFVDMMANDMISNRIYSSNNTLNPYLISEDNIYRNTNEMIYLSCDENIRQQTNNNCSENL